MTLSEIRQLLPARTLVTLTVGVVVALGFVAVFLIPEYRAVETLGRQVEELKSSLAIRRQLEPVARTLKEAQAQVPAVGPVGGEGRLPLADVGRLATIFDGMATPRGLRVSAVSPDASSVTRDGLLAVRLGFLGPPAGFRDLLLALGGFGPLVKIESVTTTAGREGREYTVKCWLAVQ